MFHQRRQHTICLAKTFKRSKKSCRVFLSLRQVQSYRRNGKKLRPATWRWKNTETFTKKRSDDIKRLCRDIKKIIWMKRRLLTFTKCATRRSGKSHSLKKHQSHPNQMNLKKYRGHQDLSMKNRKLKKHKDQVMEKRLPQRQEKS